MILECTINKHVKEIKKIEITDTKNIFLKGTNPYDGLPTYFGIWINHNRLSIVTIISYRNISYEHWLNPNGYTESNIRSYLENNDNIEIITKDEFKQQLNHIKSILEI